MSIKSTFTRYDIEAQLRTVGLPNGLIKTGAIVTAQAKSNALNGADSGRLTNSIMYSVANGQKGGFNQGGGDTDADANEQLQGRPNAGTVAIGSNVDYAIYEEFGTTGERGRGAKPFLRPAVDNVVNKKEPEKALADALNNSFNDAPIKKRIKDTIA